MNPTENPSAHTPTWQQTKLPGLFLHAVSQRYYSRVGQGDGRRYVSLKTKIYALAVARHRKLQNAPDSPVIVAEELAPETLGDLTKLLLGRLETTNQSAKTKDGYRHHLALVRKHWPGGNYDKVRPREVSFDTLLKVRNRLQSAPWAAPTGFKGNGGIRTGKGYSNAYINSALARFGNVMALARAKGLCAHDPFNEDIGLNGSLWLPLPKREKNLPSLEQFQQIFTEIERVVPGVNGRNGSCAEEPAFVAWRQTRAIEASEHARFLAYTGCRLEEANAAMFEDEIVDEKGRHWMRIHGTKTASSDRVIYAFPPLRALLTEIRERRTKAGEPTKGRILRPKTSRDAIKKACERLKLPKMGHHTMRHYFATLALSKGVPVRIVAQWLGHSDHGATLLKVYAHVIREESAAWGEQIDFTPQSKAVPPTGA